ncbi:MAG TPA: carbonic anhydrase [Tepidisphaeraceae bacterium]|nr:carbonic anhydrase [Tepidisphaeraceae bacterium]
MLRKKLIAGAFITTTAIAHADSPSTNQAEAAHDVAIPQVVSVDAPTKAEAPNSEDSLDRLREGNSRYVLGESTFPRADSTRRYETSEDGQHPFATVLSCADSRVPPELIFDTGIGDLFVIRVAGNVADTDEVATIEYGTGHLNTPVVVVMGHTACGAVTAVANGAELHGNLAELTDNILPAVASAKHENPKLSGERLVSQSIRWNVRQAQADLFERSETIRQLVTEGKVKVVGAIYDLHSGSVLWLGEHPDQAELLTSSDDNSFDKHASVASRQEFRPTNLHDEDRHDAKSAKSSKSSPADDSHSKSTKSHSADDAHGLSADSSDHNSADEHAATEEGEHGETEATTKAESHGLLIPAMFMLGGVALSSTLVFVIRTRRPLASAPKSESKPDSHGSH